MSTTPNMGLLLPDPQVTLGPAWATQLNTALGLVDSHNHAPGSGSLIGTAGIRIDADFDFSSYNATGLRTVRVTDQTSITLGATDLRAVYSKGGDLYYVNAAGAQVQITSGSSIAGATGSISGLVSPASASYSSITGSFSFLKDSSKPGKLAISEISLYEYDNASAAPITIKSPASLGAAYSLTLPTAVPTTTSTVFMSSTGALSLTGGNTYATLGSATVPSYTFSGDTNTGLYSAGADTVNIAAGGALIATFAASGLNVGSLSYYAGAGSVNTPAFSFGSDSDTGMYSPGANLVGFTVAGVETLRLNSSQVLSNSVGSAGNPVYTFNADPDTGMYRPGANLLAVSAGGTLAAQFGPGAIISPTGTVAAPCLTINNGTTGFYYPTTSSIATAIGGSEITRVTTSGLATTGLTVSSSAAITGGLTVTNTATFAAVATFTAGATFNDIITANSAITFDGGTSSIRIHGDSGTLAGVSSVTITAPGGATIKGIFGSYGSSTVSSILPTSPSSGSSMYFSPGASLDRVFLVNTFGTTQTYRVVLFY